MQKGFEQIDTFTVNELDLTATLRMKSRSPPKQGLQLKTERKPRRNDMVAEEAKHRRAGSIGETYKEYESIQRQRMHRMRQVKDAKEIEALFHVANAAFANKKRIIDPKGRLHTAESGVSARSRRRLPKRPAIAAQGRIEKFKREHEEHSEYVDPPETNGKNTVTKVLQILNKI